VGRADPWLESEPYGGLGTMRSFVRDNQFSSGERFSLRPFGNY